MSARCTLLAVAATLVLVAAAPSAAYAAPGDLTFAGCIGDIAGCTATSPANLLDSALGIAVSPDGGQLYVASRDGNAVTHLRLDAAGNPAFADCIGDVAGCAPTGKAGPLAGAEALALSADGRRLFVAAIGGNAINELTPDAGGKLSFVSCIGPHAGCTPTFPSDALNSAQAVGLSGDGKHLYAAGIQSGQTVISHITVDPSGHLGFHDCIGGSSGCTPAPAGVFNGVGAAQGLLPNTDGSHVYAAAQDAGAVSHLKLTGAGSLSLVDCVGGAGCRATGVSGALHSSAALAFGHGGGTLYGGAAALIRMALDASANTQFGNCLGDVAGCTAATPAQAVHGVFGLALTADNTHLYTAAGSQISHVLVDAGGMPRLAGCIGALAGCTPTVPADVLHGASGLALSPDGRSLYATSYNGNALVHFTIEQSPTSPVLGPGSPLPPVLSAFSMRRRRFRVARAGKALTALRRRTPRGSSFRYTLDSAALVQITVSALLPGRRSGGRCVKPSRRLRGHHARCTRRVTKGALGLAGRRGVNEVAFSGRIGRRALRPGRYRAEIVADNSVAVSAARTLSFTVVKR